MRGAQDSATRLSAASAAALASVAAAAPDARALAARKRSRTLQSLLHMPQQRSAAHPPIPTRHATHMQAGRQAPPCSHLSGPWRPRCAACPGATPRRAPPCPPHPARLPLWLWNPAAGSHGPRLPPASRQQRRRLRLHHPLPAASCACAGGGGLVLGGWEVGGGERAQVWDQGAACSRATWAGHFNQCRWASTHTRNTRGGPRKAQRIGQSQHSHTEAERAQQAGHPPHSREYVSLLLVAAGGGAGRRRGLAARRAPRRGSVVGPLPALLGFAWAQQRQVDGDRPPGGLHKLCSGGASKKQCSEADAI